jgi:hypothetical protein
MFSKMLVATDLSEMSDRIIPALLGLKFAGTQEILLLHGMNIRDLGAVCRASDGAGSRGGDTVAWER